MPVAGSEQATAGCGACFFACKIGETIAVIKVNKR